MCDYLLCKNRALQAFLLKIYYGDLLFSLRDFSSFDPGLMCALGVLDGRMMEERIAADAKYQGETDEFEICQLALNSDADSTTDKEFVTKVKESNKLQIATHMRHYSTCRQT